MKRIISLKSLKKIIKQDVKKSEVKYLKNQQKRKQEDQKEVVIKIQQQ